MGLLQLLVVLSAVLALTGAVPAMRRRRWYAFWPAPIIGLVVAGGLRDLILLLGGQSVDVSAPSLVLGVWAAVVVAVAGAMEIAVCWREELPKRAFVAPALLVAGGVTVFTPLLAVRNGGSLELAGVLAGLLIIAAGALLAVGRLWPIHQGFVRYAWPVALTLGALASSRPTPTQPVDTFAAARREVEELVAEWRRAGFRVAGGDSTLDVGGWRIALMVRYRVEGVEVRIYEIAHETASGGDLHLEPHLVPPPTHGVQHLHRGAHILVVCLTDDWRFAQHLDELVRALGDTAPRPGARS